MPDAARAVGVGDIVRYRGTGPDHDPARPHSIIVAMIFEGEAILVPLSSFRPENDKRWKIEKDEIHKNVLKHDSFILFVETKTVSIDNLRSLIAEGRVCCVGETPVEILDRVLEGLKERYESLSDKIRRALVAAGVVKVPAPRKPTI